MSRLLAKSVSDVIGGITPPPQIQSLTSQGGAGGISFFLSRIIELIYTASAVIFVFMVLWSALQWIMSGGDKEKVGAAQKRLTYAIIGIVFLAVAFVIIRVIGEITGFSFFTPTQPPATTCTPYDPTCYYQTGIP